MINSIPIISIIIPCQNEEAFVRKCLDSIIANDFPKDKMEVLVVDGMSKDRTRDIAMGYSEKYPFIKLLNNNRKITPVAMNIGIMESVGDYILILSCHSKIEDNFLRKNIESFKKYAVDCVGGILVTLPASNTLIARTIALALSNPFGVGNSYFRIGLKEPKFVDTVPFGSYKKEVFKRIGMFNENLIRNQDIEFNLRLKNDGGKILLVPDIVSYYHSRSTLKALAMNNFSNGFWVTYGSRFAKLPFSLRHLIPLAFVFFLLSSLIMSFFYSPIFYFFSFILITYLIAGMFYSLKLSLKNGLSHFPLLISTFFTLHISYGLGSLWGFLKLVTYKT